MCQMRCSNNDDSDHKRKGGVHFGSPVGVGRQVGGLQQKAMRAARAQVMRAARMVREKHMRPQYSRAPPSNCQHSRCRRRRQPVLIVADGEEGNLGKSGQI